MVRIKKRAVEGGHLYELEDFEAYLRELENRKIERPLARFKVFVSSENEELISRAIADWQSQIALLFKLSPATGIRYEIISE
jgi:hypothetical protein